MAVSGVLVRAVAACTWAPHHRYQKLCLAREMLQVLAALHINGAGQYICQMTTAIDAARSLNVQQHSLPARQLTVRLCPVVRPLHRVTLACLCVCMDVA